MNNSHNPEHPGSPASSERLTIAVSAGGFATASEVEVLCTVGDGHLQFAGDALLDQLLAARRAGRATTVSLRTDQLRAAIPEAPAIEPYAFFGGAVVVDPGNRSVSLSGRAIGMTAREYNLTAFLGRSPGKLYLRDDILRQVWNWNPAYGDNTLTVHVTRVRGKLGAGAILTSPGFGYKAAP